MLKDDSTVIIGNQTYQFHNRINTRPELLESFNRLADVTFGIQFQSVGGEYEPHILADGNMVCANVSVNQIPFYDQGKRKFFIQLGTVMTQQTCRNRGLCRWLMELILDDWKSKCDVMYLFANDSALDFYPKFGFELQTEYEYAWNEPSIPDFNCKKLSMDDSKTVSFVYEKYQERNVFSSFSMIDNKSIFDFYSNGIFKNSIYFLEKHNVIVFAEFEAGKVHCYDIFGETNSELREILLALKHNADDELVLGFAPKSSDNLICRKHKEEDTTLFVKLCGDSEFELKKRMFPIISHA